MELIFTVVIVIIAVAAIISVAMLIASHSFRCNSCSQEFKISWQRVIITVHSGEEYKLVCPHCGKKGWCTRQAKK